MVEPQPAKLPIWNTGGTNRTEPTSGEKVTGWSLSDQPPSSYFNWLQYYAGAWLTWLNERIYKGSGEHDLIIEALQPDASGDGGDLILKAGPPNTAGAGGKVDIRGGSGGAIGDGGDILLTAGATGNGDGGDVETKGGAGGGTDKQGGYVWVRSGASTGTGDGRVTLQAATAAAGSGTGSNSPEDYVVCRGDLRQVNHPLYSLLADPETTRGVGKITSKAQPTAPAGGDFYLDSATDQFAIHNGTRYHNLNRSVYNMSDDGVKGISPLTTSWTPNKYHAFERASYAGTGAGTPLRFTIPAGSLRVGSIIRVRASYTNVPDADYLNPCVIIGAVLTGSPPYVVTTPLVSPNVAVFEQNRLVYTWDRYFIECDIRVRAIGASGRYDFGGWGQTSTLSANLFTYVDETIGSSTNYNTGLALDVYPAVYNHNSTSEYAECVKFLVEVL